MVSISHALARVKDDLPRLIERHVNDELAQLGRRRGRRRLLDPLATVLLFITQVMHGNTAIVHLRHLAGMACSATAFCKARRRLPLQLFTRLAQRVTADLMPACDDACRWRGHRVWRSDATSVSMPDEPALQARFGQSGAQRAGCGFPVATLLTLCNAVGLVARTIALPLRTHEASWIAQLHEHLAPGDVLVYDRAGCSYAHLALLLRGKLHAIFRMHQRQIVSFQPGRKQASQHPEGARAGKPTSQWVRRLGRHDQLVRWVKPKTRPAWMTQEQYDALPDTLELRELRYAVSRKGFRTQSVTLVTTLTDPSAYPADELAEQYRLRWQIEIDFRHLKQTMKMDVLKCKTVDGVLKELAVFTLVYNLVRLVMLRAAQRQKAPPDRISFVDALRWLCAARDGDEPVDLIVNPQRTGRVEPRVLKRRKDRYPYMTKPRPQLRQALMGSAVRA